jgi:hypothetical protein
MYIHGIVVVGTKRQEGDFQMTDEVKLGVLVDQPSVELTLKVFIDGVQKLAKMGVYYTPEVMVDATVAECVVRGWTSFDYTVEISRTGFITLAGHYDASAVE